MKPFSDRNPVTVGLVGLALTVTGVALTLGFTSLPFIDSQVKYSAYFTEAGGLAPGASVQVSGFQMGSVSAVSLDGPRVRVDFTLDKSARLGDGTEAAIKTRSLLGTRLLEVTPRGDGTLSGPIPLERTSPPYQLTEALSDLGTNIGALDTSQLSESLATLAETFADTPLELQAAVRGLGRFSQSLNNRDQQLRTLLSHAYKATAVLSERSDQVVVLIRETNALLAQLQAESSALDQISGNLSNLSRQLSGLVSDNRTQLNPSLEKLNGVLTIVANRKSELQESIKRLNAFAMSQGEAVSTGPWFNSYIGNLLPGQFIQPFVDAAFSDLGLDPNVKLPSELTDLPTGQPGTPALPVPYPRTGQGGDPQTTLPDAITGKPGDPRYPYREPLPAPAPGGPPPGPPLPGAESAEPAPMPVNQPAIGEAPRSGGAAP